MAGGNAMIGQQLYPLQAGAGFDSVRVSPRMVCVDSSKPDLVGGFTRKKFTAMIEGIRASAIAARIVDPDYFEAGIRALYRTAEADGVFCYMFFKAVRGEDAGPHLAFGGHPVTLRGTLADSWRIAAVWLTEWMSVHEITLWGAADLRDFFTPGDESGRRFPLALSWAIPMNPRIMAGIRNGPNQAYADEYARVNNHIKKLSEALAAELKARGFRSLPLGVSDRTDAVHVKGEFPHKTAATRAGLGWVGRHCQLIARSFGPWLRLGTVFTDMEIPCGPPKERNFCGQCRRCVEACPAKALKGSAWYPGIPREELLDVHACDQWKKEHYFQYHKGHNCGICSAVCPYGLKTLKQTPDQTQDLG